MVGSSSTPSTPNPSDTLNTADMSSSPSQPIPEKQSENETTHQPKTQENQTHVEESPDLPTGNHSEAPNDHKESVEAEDGEGEDEEEQGECGFCLFMKGGACRETFIAWEKCVEEGEKNNEDIVDKCVEVTTKLRDCMFAHPDYYAPILQAEKAAQEDVAREIEEEKEKNLKKEETLGSA